MLNHRVSSDFYNFETQYVRQKDIFRLSKKEYLMPFVYPSFVAIPFSLFTPYPVSVTYFVLTLINCLLVIMVVYSLLKELKIFSSGLITSLSYLLFLSFIPLWEALRQGQLSFIIFAGFVLSWFFLKRQKNLIGGLFLSLLFVRPHLVILPLLIFAWKREWKTVFGLLLGIALMILISGLATGLTSLYRYVELLWSIPSLGNAYTIHPQLEPTIRGFLQSLYHTDSLKEVAPAFIPIALLTIGALIYAWRGKVITKGQKFNFQWAILILITLLTSLHTNPHDLLPSTFAIMILFTTFVKSLYRHKNRLGRVVLVFYLFLFFIIIVGAAMYVPLITTPILFLTLIILIILSNRTLAQN